MKRVIGQHLSREDRDEIIRLGREKVPLLDILDATGASRNTIVATLRGADIEPTPRKPGLAVQSVSHPQRAHFSLDDGVILIGSDAHYWPGPASVMHRALVKFASDLSPKAFVLNGDAFDGATISKHARIGWDSRPTVQQELETCQERLAEIVDALPRRAARVWCLGNHDARMETKIANTIPEYAGVKGFTLADHFPGWEKAWSCFVNEDIVVKHRIGAGIHAPYNNAVKAGRTTVTGHLHSAKVYPVNTYNGTHWGVDAGCIADPYGPQFTDYTEDSPRNWVQAFCVLTVWKGALLPPELVTAFDRNSVVFRGEVIRV